MSTPKVAVLGGGVMGTTVASAVLAAGWDGADVTVAEPRAERRAELTAEHGLATAETAAEAVAGAGVVVVAVKPNQVGAVLEEVAPALEADVVVVTVAAGLAAAFYEERLPAGTPVVRVMPNTPAVIGKGASAVAPGAHASEEHVALTERLLASTGLVVRVAEKDLDAVTAVSGSGPAYVFYVIDAMAEAGVLLGLTRELATQLAVATVEGAGAMVSQTGEHPAVLRERVSSPGGTTVAALQVLDEHGVRAGILAAAERCRDRSLELGAPAPGPSAS
ncbi:MAG: pyrroline-5-carboxylate reductase [Actinomycetales bacterium]|nr:pyrroline-5-carboxylate reductase [Actinomycetales bacterium]